jgi:L-ascorbate metabolism protein UlaG (beta-lactamase superfamily)
MELKDFIKSIVKWYGQFSLEFDINGKTLFIDPFNLPNDYNKKADWIFISHDHFDHLSFDDLAKVANPDTPIYAAKNLAKQVKDKGYTNVIETWPGEKYELEGVVVETVPMYNIKKDFHKKETGWTAFVLTIDGKRIYISVDTERIPEMKEINADITFMTLGQTYTMNSVEEAVDAVLDTGAKLAIPVHFGMYEGTQEDADKFCEMLIAKGVQCIQLEKLGRE